MKEKRPEHITEVLEDFEGVDSSISELDKGKPKEFIIKKF